MAIISKKYLHKKEESTKLGNLTDQKLVNHTWKRE
jgi:hypothetical protein